MKIYKHENYKEYKKAQIKKNKRKLKHVWVKPAEILMLSKKIKTYVPDASFGICHGVRNGWEVQELRRLLKIEVIGTDISPTVKEFKNTIQWDFHNMNDEWRNKVDFIYSNSFDHSYDPERCLNVWMKCIRKNIGVCFIHWLDINKDTIDSADCFAGTYKEYGELISQNFNIIDVFGSPGRKIFAINHKKSEKINEI